MRLIDEYFIRKIDNNLAQEVVIKNHYLHRQAPCSIAFGLFKKEYVNIFGSDDGEMVGVIMYGSPASPSLCKGICGEDEKDNVIELTRLWIKDEVGKNAESFLIGNTMKRVGKDIIVSFADTNQGHLGTIYQATNGIYTGLSAKRTEWSIKGLDLHCKSLSNLGTAEQLKAKYGDSFSYKERSIKHRYIWFIGSKKRKKELLNKLKYPIKKYPKKHIGTTTGGLSDVDNN